MKGGDDRDQAIEHLLRQSLGSGSGADASNLCLDAETLAAWLDGSLDDRALAMTEAHVSGCARCQALAAATVRAAPEKAAQAPWWKPAWSAGWLVPLTAAAGAVVLWMAVPGQGPVPRSSNRNQPLARAEAPSPAERPPSNYRPPARLDDLSNRRADAAKEARTAPAPAAPPVSEMQGDAGRQTAGSPSDEKTMSAGRIANAAEPERERAAARAAESPAAQTLGRLRQSAPVGEIVSPDPASRWRLRPGGSVEHSSDGGSTWEVQSTGVSAELTAGSSPAPSVCWLVGRGGIVLLTIDGRRWQRTAFPEPLDLAGVQAADARTATITTIDGRTYRTMDSGQTWVGP